ncbi:MAG: hypothetical protein JW894_02545 [Bacteroidales bacterium]|nr:hypothetical protein [Bacteroidales bacterium]
MKKKQKKNKLKGKMSRKEAIGKMSLTALSAATMMHLLNKPEKALAQGDSPDTPPEWP